MYYLFVHIIVATVISTSQMLSEISESDISISVTYFIMLDYVNCTVDICL